MAIERMKQDDPNNMDIKGNLSSRWVITSSVIGQAMDGAPGEGGPFMNSLIKALIKNSRSKISVSELIKQVEEELNATTSGYVKMIPGIGILRNSNHDGGELSFTLKDEFIELASDSKKDEKEILEKSIRESMKRLEKEFLDKLEASQKIFERKTTMLDNNALTERIVLDKKKLLGLLKKDEIEAYFDEVDLMQNSIDDNMLKEVVLLQGRWTASENQRRLGVISPEDELLEKNKVRSGLIDISIRIKTVSKD